VTLQRREPLNPRLLRQSLDLLLLHSLQAQLILGGRHARLACLQNAQLVHVDLAFNGGGIESLSRARVSCKSICRGDHVLEIYVQVVGQVTSEA